MKSGLWKGSAGAFAVLAMADDDSSSDEVFFFSKKKQQPPKKSAPAYAYGEEETFEYGEQNEEFTYGETDGDGEEGHHFAYGEEEDAEQAEEEADERKHARETVVASAASYAAATALPEEAEADAAEKDAASRFASLSPYAHRFVRDFTRLFPDPSRAPWTEALQWALELPASDAFAADQRRQIISSVFELFTECGRRFAIQLIEESLLPESQRTLQPTSRFGGVAGGKKYCVHATSTQVFKFAEDVPLGNDKFLYGGVERNDRLAQKAAGHELKATQALIDSAIPQLSFPLMAIFTYRGKRVTCTSLVPIKKLVQGQASVKDGLLVPTTDAPVSSVMAALGGALNLSSKPLGVFGPFDLEVHVGSDGRFYVLDTARLFPPEKPSAPRRHLVALLRPEMLRKSGTPLASDAFFPAVAKRHDCASLQEDIARITQHMFAECERLGQDIAAGRATLGEGREQAKKLLHDRGINMRHLPRILKAADRPVTWRPEGGRPLIKTLRPPRERSREELSAILVSQNANLSGKDRVRMVPTLLSLGRFVENSEAPLQLGQFHVYQGAYIVIGQHPFAQAFQVAIECGALEIDLTNGMLVNATQMGLLAVYHLMQLMKKHPFPAQYEQGIRAPTRQWLWEMAPKCFPPGPMQTEIVRFAQMFPMDPLWDCMKDTAIHGETDIVEKLYKAHDAHMAAGAAYALAGRLEELKALAESTGTNLGMFHHQNRNMLQWACEGKGGTAVVDLYLEKGMPPDIFCTVAAAASNNVAILNALLKAGIDVNERQERDGTAAVILAAEQGNLDALKWFVEHKADPNVTKRNGADPLWDAANMGQLECVKYLLSLPNLQRRGRVDGADALFIAVEKNHLEIAEILINAGFRAHCIRSLDGTSAVQMAVFRGSVPMLKLLLSKGAAAGHQAKDGTAPMHVAAVSGRADMIRILLAAKAPVDPMDHQKATPLMKAAQHGRSDAIRALLEGHANKSLKWQGMTPQIIAEKCQHPDCAELLK